MRNKKKFAWLAGVLGCLLLIDMFFVGITPYLFYGLVIEPMNQEKRSPGIHKKYDQAISLYYASERAKKNGDNKLMSEKRFEAAIIYSSIDLYAAKNMLDTMDFSTLSGGTKAKALELKEEVEMRLKIYHTTLHQWSSESDFGYCNTEDNYGDSYKRAKNYEMAAEHYKRAFESFGYSRMEAGFGLVASFEALGKYKDAIYVADEIINERLTNQNGISDLIAIKERLTNLDLKYPSQASYYEQYSKFKDYKKQYIEARKISSKEDPAKAESELRKAIALAPKDVDIVRTRLHLLYILYESAQYDRALEEINWLKQNFSILNDRMVDHFDGYVWLIKKKKAALLKP